MPTPDRVKLHIRRQKEQIERTRERLRKAVAVDPKDQAEVDRLIELRGRLLEMQHEAEQVQMAPPGFLDKLEPGDRQAIISNLSRVVTVAICFATIAFLAWVLYDLECRKVESGQGRDRTGDTRIFSPDEATQDEVVLIESGDRNRVKRPVKWIADRPHCSLFNDGSGTGLLLPNGRVDGVSFAIGWESASLRMQRYFEQGND